MSGRGPSPAAADRDPRAERLAALGAHLGVDLPPFEGPLIAFRAAGQGEPDDPVYLGGDLHAVHPEARAARPQQGHDEGLDTAEITIANFEHPALETTALEGLWCLVLEGPILDTAPYLGITDGQGRRRTWILLPLPPQMVGIGHYWLPAVAPLGGAPPRGREGRRDRRGAGR